MALQLVTTSPSAKPQQVRRIRMLRGTAGMTQRALAERLGVDTRTVRHWEAGSAAPSDEHWWALSDLFGCSVAFVAGAPLDDDGKPSDGLPASAAQREQERAALSDVAAALAEAILRLPRGSEWRWACVGIRKHMLHAIE
jgi:transcriptional regulator with XRE-family HTH domain